MNKWNFVTPKYNKNKQVTFYINGTKVPNFKWGWLNVLIWKLKQKIKRNKMTEYVLNDGLVTQGIWLQKKSIIQAVFNSSKPEVNDVIRDNKSRFKIVDFNRYNELYILHVEEIK